MEERLMMSCPVCKSENIKQDTISEPFNMHMIVGNEPNPRRFGSHCEDCGVKFKFNRISEEEYEKPMRERRHDAFNATFGKTKIIIDNIADGVEKGMKGQKNDSSSK